jgi:2-haloacid dehalogenase
MNTKIARREFFLTAGLGAVAVMAQAQRANSKVMPKALVFDTFGTVVDWRSSIIEEGTVWGKEHRMAIDWAKFAERWRAGYGPAMNKVRTGEMPWTKLDDLHRMILEDVLKEFGMNGLTEEQKDHWNKVWHRLKPWPDSVAGLTRLKKKFIIGPMSNGNIGLMTDMAKNAGLPWDVILGAELVRH